MTTLLISTYPRAGAGTPAGLGEGLWLVELDDVSGALADARLVAELPSPSFVAVDGDRVHAVLEAQDGEVVTLAGPDLVEVGRSASGGAYPCHVLPLPGGRIAVANYGTGTLGVLTLAGGAVGAGVVAFGHEGHGPRADRQEGPHAHFVALVPGGRHLVVADLGTDQLRRYALSDGEVRPDGIAATFPPGTGPRHLAFAAGHAYVAGELDARVHVLAWDEPTATGAWVGAVPAVVGPPRAAPHGQGGDQSDDRGDGRGDDRVRHGEGDLTSHLAVDGDDVVVTVRGADVLTRYRIAADGSLQDGSSVELGGHWPRHFATVGAWTVVALERAHELVTIARDGSVAARLALPSPACVAVA